jgi:hypothetical protein
MKLSDLDVDLFNYSDNEKINTCPYRGQNNNEA